MSSEHFTKAFAAGDVNIDHVTSCLTEVINRLSDHGSWKLFGKSTGDQVILLAIQSMWELANTKHGARALVDIAREDLSLEQMGETLLAVFSTVSYAACAILPPSSRGNVPPSLKHDARQHSVCCDNCSMSLLATAGY